MLRVGPAAARQVSTPISASSWLFGTRLHCLHFDANYRLSRAQWRSQLEENSLIASVERELDDPEDRQVYERTDLYKMHTYRDALLRSRRAYVLFPGTGADASLFVRHPERTYRDSSDIARSGLSIAPPECKSAESSARRLHSPTA